MLKRISKFDKNRSEYVQQKEVKTFSLEHLRNLKIAYIPYNELLKEGFFAGLGWAFGVTIGFVLISTIVVAVLKSLGGVPLIGAWFASIVEATLQQLSTRTPVF
jgi:hypothetical protein